MAALEPEMFDVKAAEAMEAGIKVVTYDTDIRTSANRLSYIAQIIMKPEKGWVSRGPWI